MLEKMKRKKRKIREFVDEYTMPNGRMINLLGEYMLKNRKLKKDVYSVPADIDKEIARLKLNAMGIKIDKLTPEQKKYPASRERGT